MRSSTFEEINITFGIFPKEFAYPVYFAGDIENPKGKKIFLGINPGYSLKKNGEVANRQILEQEYLDQQGLYKGYCKIFSDFFGAHENGLIPYFANIAGFMARYYKIKEKIDWCWLQDNFISLDFIPYHSVNSAGLRINDQKVFREVYVEILIRILRYLNPQEAIFFHGFPTFSKVLTSEIFHDVFRFQKHGNFWVGRIDNYDFIGLPFLTRVAGGKDALVRAVRDSKALKMAN